MSQLPSNYLVIVVVPVRSFVLVFSANRFGDTVDVIEKTCFYYPVCFFHGVSGFLFIQFIDGAHRVMHVKMV